MHTCELHYILFLPPNYFLIKIIIQWKVLHGSYRHCQGGYLTPTPSKALGTQGFFSSFQDIDSE